MVQVKTVLSTYMLALMFEFAMNVTVIAKNLNATCSKVMYILIYNETDEAYIYILIRKQEFKNVINLLVLFIVEAVVLPFLNYFTCVHI
jgi:hypothetical protein